MAKFSIQIEVYLSGKRFINYLKDRRRILMLVYNRKKNNLIDHDIQCFKCFYLLLPGLHHARTQIIS